VGVRRSAAKSTGKDEEGRRYIACVGPIESHKRLKDAVWAFDVLHYIYKDLHLLLIGTGPDEPRLRTFVRDVGIEDLVHFLGDRSDLAELFALSELVWVPGRSGGVGAIVEAMAASRPVIATRLPESAELLADGATGCLVPANDPAELSRQTRRLMDDVSLRARMGEAGRQRATREFDAADMVRDYEAIYEELTTRVSACAG
jgi:glycosyltransferase involved in cell wall biosynthesis